MEQNVSTEKKSSEVIVVTSGKGGVGKDVYKRQGKRAHEPIQFQLFCPDG